MDSLIRFRKLYDSLNLYEREAFFNTIIDSFTMDLFVTALFNHFSESMTQFKPYNNSYIQTMNTTLSNIIHQRKRNTEETDNTTIHELDSMITDISIDNNLKIDELPSPLIAYISSYLELENVVQFEKCNRSIFIGTRSMPLATIIDEYYFAKYLQHTMNFANRSVRDYYFDRFRFSDSLSITIGDMRWERISTDGIPCISLSHRSIWNHLKELEMVLNFKHFPLLSYYILTQLSQCDLTNLSTLKLCGDHFFFKLVLNVNLFSKLDKLEHLSVIMHGGRDSKLMWAETHQFGMQLANLLYLKQLSIHQYNHWDLNPILKTIGNKLEIMAIQSYEYSETCRHFLECNLNNLKELTLSTISHSHIDDLVNANLQNLEKIHMNIDSFTDIEVSDEHKHSLELLFGLKTLKYIDIENCEDGGKKTTEMMISILLNSLKHNKYEIMSLNIHDEADDDNNSMGKYINKLVNLLHCQCKHYRLAILFCSKGNTVSYDMREIFRNDGNKFDIKYDHNEGCHGDTHLLEIRNIDYPNKQWKYQIED